MAAKNQANPDIQTEHVMWTMHCKEALGTMQKSINALDVGQRSDRSAIDRIEGKLENGLVKKVDSIERRMWAVAGATILTLIGVLANILIERLS